MKAIKDLTQKDKNVIPLTIMGVIWFMLLLAFIAPVFWSKFWWYLTTIQVSCLMVQFYLLFKK